MRKNTTAGSVIEPFTPSFTDLTFDTAVREQSSEVVELFTPSTELTCVVVRVQAGGNVATLLVAGGARLGSVRGVAAAPFAARAARRQPRWVGGATGGCIRRARCRARSRRRASSPPIRQRTLVSIILFTT